MAALATLRRRRGGIYTRSDEAATHVFTRGWPNAARARCARLYGQRLASIERRQGRVVPATRRRQRTRGVEAMPSLLRWAHTPRHAAAAAGRSTLPGHATRTRPQTHDTPLGEHDRRVRKIASAASQPARIAGTAELEGYDPRSTPRPHACAARRFAAPAKALSGGRQPRAAFWALRQQPNPCPASAAHASRTCGATRTRHPVDKRRDRAALAEMSGRAPTRLSLSRGPGCDCAGAPPAGRVAGGGRATPSRCHRPLLMTAGCAAWRAIACASRYSTQRCARPSSGPRCAAAKVALHQVPGRWISHPQKKNPVQPVARGKRGAS